MIIFNAKSSPHAKVRKSWFPSFYKFPSALRIRINFIVQTIIFQVRFSDFSQHRMKQLKSLQLGKLVGESFGFFMLNRGANDTYVFTIYY